MIPNTTPASGIRRRYCVHISTRPMVGPRHAHCFSLVLNEDRCVERAIFSSCGSIDASELRDEKTKKELH